MPETTIYPQERVIGKDMATVFTGLVTRARRRILLENGLTESSPGVSGDAGVSSGLEKRE